LGMLNTDYRLNTLLTKTLEVKLAYF